MKDGSLIIQGKQEIWEPRQVQVESIVTAAFWCLPKHFPLSNRNRTSKYFFTGMCEISALSNRSLTWSRLKLTVPICKFYLYRWKLSFLWAPQDRVRPSKGIKISNVWYKFATEREVWSYHFSRNHNLNTTFILETGKDNRMPIWLNLYFSSIWVISCLSKV